MNKEFLEMINYHHHFWNRLSTILEQFYKEPGTRREKKPNSKLISKQKNI